MTEKEKKNYLKLVKNIMEENISDDTNITRFEASIKQIFAYAFDKKIPLNDRKDFIKMWKDLLIKILEQEDKERFL